jgi:anti-repressor protein
MNTNIQTLIPISDNNGKKAVSARLLHAFLESKRDFSNWIKDRITRYGLVENQDFEVFDKFIENSDDSLLNNFGKQTGRGGHNRIEYTLSLSCAKEIAMVEGNAKGKQARQYFIACEEKISGGIQAPLHPRSSGTHHQRDA